MKLGALCSAIRALNGAPRIQFNLANLHAVTLPVQKGGMLEELQRVFNADRTFETGLWLDANGFILREGHVAVTPGGIASDDSPDDDLIG